MTDSWRSIAAVAALVWWASTAAVQGSEAGTARADFESANLLYEKGRYADAAQAYEDILAGGTRTAPLLFNLGNARFKSGEVGRAVVSWLQAEALAPRNNRIQINLEFARRSVSGGAQPVPWWPEQLKLLTLNEWAGISMGALWIWFGGMTLGTWKPAWRPALRVPILISAVATVLVTILLTITARDRAGTVTAVVVTPEAVVRYGPLKESQSAFVARDGSEFRMTDFKDEWIRVQDPTGRDGWVTADQVALLRAGRPIER